MWIIKKEFEFSASHNLCKLSETHPCAKVHGHNYTVVVELRSEHLSDAGFVLDYHLFAPIKQWIDTNLDHQHLNGVLPCNPTAENIAAYLFEVFESDFPQLYAITVSETPKTSARYEKHK